jgi:MFS family permease
MRSLWLTVYIPSFLIAAGQQAVVVLLPLYALALDGGAGLAAAVTALRGFGSMAINVPTGILVARFGDKATMIGALVTMGVTTVLIGLARDPFAIGVLAVVSGAGSGAWLTARLAYVADTAPIAYRGRALATLGGIQRFGLLVGPFAGGVITSAYGYNVAFGVAGACAFASCVLVIVLTQSVRSGSAAAEGFGLKVVWDIIREHRHTFSTAGLSTVALAMLRSSRQLLIPVWGAGVGLSEAQIGFTFLLSSAIEIAMSYPAGYLIDHHGHKTTGLPCFGLLALSIALLPLVQGLYSLIAIALIAGVGNGFGAGIIMTLGSDYAPPERRGEFLGVWRMLGDTGLVAGPVIVGAVAGAASLGLATVTIAGIGLGGMALMAFVVREPRRS